MKIGKGKDWKMKVGMKKDRKGKERDKERKVKRMK